MLFGNTCYYKLSLQTIEQEINLPQDIQIISLLRNKAHKLLTHVITKYNYKLLTTLTK
jgi:hypothetical protein